MSHCFNRKVLFGLVVVLLLVALGYPWVVPYFY